MKESELNNEEKILTLNLDGKKGVNILNYRYDAMKDAILLVMTNSSLVTLKVLGEEVEKALKNKFDGNIGWYLMAVKLDLEVRDVIERVPDKSPQTLRLKKNQTH